ncbi:MAG: aminotransferase class V-fold PLP-dependent enzyme [Acidobacteriota bacterium]|nr:aminotransferase class V-fold PLP-dependent enzyme [Acidobacteriota bacterium]
MSNDLLAWRDQFPILSRTTYLISNSLGAMPRGVPEALGNYTDDWANEGVRSWETRDWLSLPLKIGDRIASLLGAPSGSVSTHANVTLASAVAASCFDFSGKRNKIVCSSLNFPSLIYLYRQQEQRGARLHLVDSPDGVRVPLDALLEAIDERTVLVPISHIIFKSAFIQDVEAVVQRAHEVGAKVVLDVYQSAGVVPIDLTRLEVDFAVGGTLKWLCGGPGVSYLYVKPEFADTLEPALTGWMSHTNPFAFDPSPIERSTGAGRFMNGTPAIPALFACGPGLKIVNEIGVEAIRVNSIRQTQRLIDASDEHGWQVNTPRDDGTRGGTVSIMVPDCENVSRELLARDILIDFRPGAGIRLSPHFYTTNDEMDHAIETIAEIVAG